MAMSNDNLALKRHVWFVRIGVPKSLQGIIGKTMLTESTGQRDHAKAKVAAVAILERMRARIEDAKANNTDPLKSEAATLARRYQEARAVSLDEATNLLITDVVAFCLETLPKASAADVRALLMRTANVNMALAAVPGAVAAVGLITGTMTPFTTHQASWEAAKAFNAKTLHEYRQTMAHFVKTVGKPCEAITFHDVSDWIAGLMAGDNGNSAKTISKKLACVGGYWNWMVDKRKITDANTPFKGHKIESNEMTDAANARRRFEPTEMVRILAAAQDKCQALGDLVMLAMYTGARRESLAGLNVKNIKPAMYGMPAHIHFMDKTKAGVRDVPIHPAIADLVERLVINATDDGQLFRGNADKFGDYGVTLGQKFGELKTDMGFDGRYTFHCIRKTFTYILTEANISVKTINDIAGWENGNGKGKMQSHYAQEASLTTKAKALASLVYPD